MRWLLLFLCFGLQAQEIALKAKDVVWNPQTCVLTWTVEQGKPGDKFVAEKTTTFTISFHEALMNDGKQTFKFDQKEAQEMHNLFHQLVTKYALESTVWFLNEQEKGSLKSSLH